MTRKFALKVLTWPRWEQAIVLQVQTATDSPHLVLPTTTWSSLIGVERAASIFSATAMGLWVDCGRESQAWQGSEDIPAAWGQVIGSMRMRFDIQRLGFTIRLTMAWSKSYRIIRAQVNASLARWLSRILCRRNTRATCLS